MAHELLIEHGKAAMFYVGEPPWHRLGTRLDGPSTAFGSTNAPRLLESIWFGTGARTKIRAWDEAIKLCQAPAR